MTECAPCLASPVRPRDDHGAGVSLEGNETDREIARTAPVWASWLDEMTGANSSRLPPVVASADGGEANASAAKPPMLSSLSRGTYFDNYYVRALTGNFGECGGEKEMKHAGAGGAACGWGGVFGGGCHASVARPVEPRDLEYATAVLERFDIILILEVGASSAGAVLGWYDPPSCVLAASFCHLTCCISPPRGAAVVVARARQRQRQRPPPPPPPRRTTQWLSRDDLNRWLQRSLGLPEDLVVGQPLRRTKSLQQPSQFSSPPPPPPAAAAMDDDAAAARRRRRLGAYPPPPDGIRERLVAENALDASLYSWALDRTRAAIARSEVAEPAATAAAEEGEGEVGGSRRRVN